MKWRYSLRWKLPYPCPGEHELVSRSGGGGAACSGIRYVTLGCRSRVCGLSGFYF
ncbi:hypothetical protein OIU92_31210 [Escherichia coli]|nr:hypothetical protein [Escherichia coli]